MENHKEKLAIFDQYAQMNGFNFFSEILSDYDLVLLSDDELLKPYFISY